MRLGRTIENAHLLHLGQHILVRGELAIETEELLFLFCQFLYTLRKKEEISQIVLGR